MSRIRFTKIRKFITTGCRSFQDLNGTLVFVGQICDQEKIVVFTAKETVILNNNSFSVNESDVLKIVKRQKQTGVYMFNESKEQKVMSASC